MRFGRREKILAAAAAAAAAMGLCILVPGGAPSPAGTGVDSPDDGSPAGGEIADRLVHLADGTVLAFYDITVTGYSSSRRETDSTPHLTASMTRVRPGCLALSRDLLRTFTPGAPFDFGDWVVIPGAGVFVVEDTMNRRWKRRADIWFPTRREALRWGKRSLSIARLPAAPGEEDSPLVAMLGRASRLQTP